MSGSKLGNALMLAAGAVVAAAVVAGIMVMGSPVAQRERRMDARRISDLEDIQQALEAHHRQYGELPADLSTLASRPGIALSVTDPVDGSPYVYRIKSTTDYTLCARFTTDSAEPSVGGRRGGAVFVDAAWAHGRGETCFVRQLEPSKR